MNFDTNLAHSSSLDKAVLAYKKQQFDQAEADCSRFLQESPRNANALYLFGLILQKQGKNDLAIDYINKAIATDAAQIAGFQATLSKPIEEDIAPEIQEQNDDDPFKATRELLKRFEKEQSNEQSTTPSVQPSFSMNIPEPGTFSADNSGLMPFIQKLYSENFSAVVLLWTGVESTTIGNLNQFPGMKFCIRHDERKSHEYYTTFLKDLKLRSMSIVTDKKIMQTNWDAFILPYTDINDAEDPIRNISFKSLYLANGFINAPNRQTLEETLKSKGCVQKNDQPGVYERKDQLLNGEQLFAEGKVEESIQCFEDVLAQDPENTDAHNNLGVISFALGNMESAEIMFMKTLEIDPNHINALMNIADVYSASGHINEAAKYLTKAIELEPKNPAVWTSLSTFYLKIGSNEEAEAAQKKSELLKQTQAK
ncbi:MAG: tetratricopeptide repeat protein [Candidatus Magnetomorum sp.]|nr:tetratricopeptide repeat protein [Candidatus Magnetomorum sp.]